MRISDWSSDVCSSDLKYGRLIKVTRPFDWAAAGKHRSTGFNGIAYQTINCAQAPLIFQRPHLSLGIERVHPAQIICVRRKPLAKCFKNVFMNKKASRRCAYLASIAVLGRDRKAVRRGKRVDVR